MYHTKIYTSTQESAVERSNRTQPYMKQTKIPISRTKLVGRIHCNIVTDNILSSRENTSSETESKYSWAHAIKFYTK